MQILVNDSKNGHLDGLLLKGDYVAASGNHPTVPAKHLPLCDVESLSCRREPETVNNIIRRSPLDDVPTHSCWQAVIHGNPLVIG